MRRLRFGEHNSLVAACVLGVLLASGVACRRGTPVVDVTRSGVPNGTISGTIRGPRVAIVTSGRTVEAVNVTTGERRRVRTTPTGAYTFELPAGTWRIEPSLSLGERLDRVPEPVPLQPGQFRTDVDVLVGAQRPRSRTPEGLAPPFA